jgi:hypothetical protein
MNSPRKTLSHNLREILELPGDRIAVRTIAQHVGDKGFGLMLAILSLPSALPVPAPGYSTPFGILLVLLGSQLVAGRTVLWLPERTLKKEVTKKFAGKIFGAGTKVLHFSEKLIRPRMRWINSVGGRMFLGFIVIFMASLMILPIPMTNTLPAMIIFWVGVSLTEDDGLAAIGAFIAGIFAAAFYAYIIYLLATLGMEGVVELKEWIKATLLGST